MDSLKIYLPFLKLALPELALKLVLFFPPDYRSQTPSKFLSLWASITLSTKVHLVKAMVFPVVMYGCESWTIKKAECQIIDAFELWCWRRLESPLDSKEIQPVHPKGNRF